MQKENLALPFQFAINRGANDPFIVRRHDRFDWQTIEWGVSIVDMSFAPTSER